MFVLVKIVDVYDLSRQEVMAVSTNKEKLEEEAKRLIYQNDLNRMIDSEIFNLAIQYRIQQPFTVSEPEEEEEQKREWQNLGFIHNNRLAQKAKQEILDKYGIAQNDLEFDRQMSLKIIEVKEI